MQPDVRGVVRAFFAISLLSDAASVYVLSQTWNQFCDKPLKFYLLASVLLGTPWIITSHYLQLPTATRFASDGASALVYFALATVGTSWTNTALLCQSTAPLLWWWAFVSNAMSWTLIIAYLCLTLILTVAGTIIGNQAKPAKQMAGGSAPEGVEATGEEPVSVAVMAA